VQVHGERGGYEFCVWRFLLNAVLYTRLLKHKKIASGLEMASARCSSSKVRNTGSSGTRPWNLDEAEEILEALP
jgi:hypothetical protein